ncbi:RagB/SusD family nutrient uptake outer membrane protein [Sphingobacterium sp. lm-10]|uniref:RagB/SusD family nutrient uptake outer membrane protein n=1 Tax=Sphingobacterium sp. lm-10 TaxID=2944904 RepID=UPI00202032A4|nr:RagB/SusD family nutrient uptake outer membrane protein [Sphingobacterium sp. lm-10]MCL7987873.1 RagB/SusD family nutrient uptake outer membrane protein [Sphingobacterium sp. lm-10]
MKTKLLSIIQWGVCTSLLITGCSKSFLEQAPLGELSEEQLSNKVGVNSLLTGAYSALAAARNDDGLGGGGPWESSPDNWIYGSVAGGEAHKGSDGGDQPAINQIARLTQDASNGFFNNKWKSSFEGVSRANQTLRFLDLATDLTDQERLEISAQARFLRAHFYFDLKKMFNQVPWVDENSESYYQPNTADIWPQIQADFEYAFANLPATFAEVGRVNKWAAAAYLGKTLLYQKKFAEARTVFTDVITNGVTVNGIRYDLVPFKNNFDAATKNNAESVFAIQMVANDGTNSITFANSGGKLNFPYESPFRCCGFYQPTQDLVNSYRTSPTTGLPYLENYNSTAVKNDMGIASTSAFTPDVTTLDPRLDWTVGRRGIPFHDWGLHPGRSWIREQVSAGPYSNKKNIYWQATQDIYSDQSSWAPGTAINVLVIRFADVLLMAAEAEAQSGSLDQALTYVNRVRTRAADPAGWLYSYINNSAPLAGFNNTPAANYVVNPYPAGYFSSQQLALNAIYFERKLELAMEGHRFFDLSRWGILQTAMNAIYQYEGTITTDVRGASAISRTNYFPIPQNQIDLSVINGSATLTQNPGY